MNTSVIHNMVSEPLFRVSVLFSLPHNSLHFAIGFVLRLGHEPLLLATNPPLPPNSSSLGRITERRCRLFFVWVTSMSVSAPRLDGIAAGPVVPAAAPPGSVELPPALQIGSGCSRRCCWLLSTPAPVDAASSAQVGSGRPDRCETCRRHYWTHAAAGLETVTGSILILTRLDLFFRLGSAS
jgi:hypothetical protein